MVLMSLFSINKPAANIKGKHFPPNFYYVHSKCHMKVQIVTLETPLLFPFQNLS